MVEISLWPAQWIICFKDGMGPRDASQFLLIQGSESIFISKDSSAWFGHCDRNTGAPSPGFSLACLSAQQFSS